jgi:hypothetical protein
MRTTVHAATPRLHDWQSKHNPANKWVRSLSWERAVLSLLTTVEELPPNLKAEIAKRLGGYINFARTARDDATLTRFIEAAAWEREKVPEEAKFTANPLWAAAALAEAWCLTRLGLSNGTLNRYSAMSVSTAIDTFAAEQAA